MRHQRGHGCLERGRRDFGALEACPPPRPAGPLQAPLTLSQRYFSALEVLRPGATNVVLSFTVPDYDYDATRASLVSVADETDALSSVVSPAKRLQTLSRRGEDSVACLRAR